METKLNKWILSFLMAMILVGIKAEKMYSQTLEGIHLRNGVWGDPPRAYQFRDIPESVGYLNSFPLDLITKEVGAENLKSIKLEYWIYTSIADAEMGIVERLEISSLLLRNMIDSPLNNVLIGDNCWHSLKETGSILFIRNNILVFITPIVHGQFDSNIMEQIAKKIDSIIINSPKEIKSSEISAPEIKSVILTSPFPKNIDDFVDLKVDAVDPNKQKLYYRQYVSGDGFTSETGDLKIYFTKNMLLTGDSTKSIVKIWVWNEDHMIASVEQIIPFLITSVAEYYDIPMEVKQKKLLSQNYPNPFIQNTIINCYIPRNVMEAKLMVFDVKGIPVKTYIIKGRDKTCVSISGTELKPGIYIYSIIIDDKEVESKRLILVK